MAGQGMKVQNRRYVGRFETFGYVLYNSANSFNIGKYTDRFLFDVLKIDLGWLFVLNNINSVWDVINDTFIGVMVDRTRTRWGKFKPYLVITAVFSGILGSLYWMQPLFFDTDPQNRNKAVVFLLLAMTSELNGTFRGLAERGMTATITPHPDDRTRLITAARFYGNFLPLGASNIVMGLLIDAINHKIIGFTLKNTFVFMGVMTSLISAMLALYFFIVVKERVVQSVNPPGIKDSLRTIIGNRPLLIIALAQLGGAFQLQGGMDNYYIDVLGAASINQIVGIPGAPISPMSYTFIPFLRRHFSTKALWIIGGDIIDWTMGLVFFFGIIGGTGANGWYNKKSRMIPILMIQEASYMCFYGARKVIPVEIENEAFDYSEWKYGYRTEGISSVALGLTGKLISQILNNTKTLVMRYFGYDLSKGFGNQSQRAKFGLFAMGTLIPLLTGSFDTIAKLFYNLTGEKRDRMYVELLANRAAKQKELSEGYMNNEEIKSTIEK